MSQQEKGTSQQGLNQSANAAYNVAKGGIKVAKGIATGTIKIKTVIIALIAFFFLGVVISLPAGTSTSQMNDTYYLSIKNGDTVNRPNEEDMQAALTDKERARQKTSELINIIIEMKQEDLDKNIKGKRIKKDCKENDWDYEITLQKAIMEQEVIYFDPPSESGKSGPTSQEVLQMSTSDSRVLAAYSVYLDNMQLESINSGLRKKIVNQRGDTVQSKWIWSDDKVDLDKSLRDILRKFMKRNSFYKLDYKRDEYGDIIVESVDLGHYEDIVDDEGNVIGRKWIPDIRDYATPIITELDINNIAEELYNLDPNDPYINSGEPYKKIQGSEIKVSKNQVTIREAINTIAENTDALLFDITVTQGDIIITDLQGQLLWPSPGCTLITSPFGRRTSPTAGASTNHLGLDIGTPYGQPIVAAESGVITFAGYNGGGGNWVSITHEKKIKTNYGHLSKIVVSTGQSVKRGQLIAYSGNSGISTGPHLHFEVIVNGNNVNPVPYVAKNENDIKYN